MVCRKSIGALLVMGIKLEWPSQNPQDFETPPTKHPYGNCWLILIFISLSPQEILTPAHRPAVDTPANRPTTALGLRAGHWPHFLGDARSEEAPLLFVGVLEVIRDVSFFSSFFLDMVCRKSTVPLLAIGIKLENIDSGSSSCKWTLPGNQLTIAAGLSEGRWPHFPGDRKKGLCPPHFCWDDRGG
ncbi:hypothetical protein CEXT_622781 [Caerostris extrusa]|uniref:Uncharacterized protein n=1 Tax=Caerostris extrusa TaxID=172846 RepID=A0AAV4QBD5_CAEEX|nr:hypothetical protein CEXT_622781 [Caerostris extrusa]